MWDYVVACGTAAILLTLVYFWQLRRFVERYPLPAFLGYPLVGMGYTKPDAHEYRLNMIRKKGAVVQCHFYGQHILMVNDGRLVKLVLEQLRGKGSLQQRAFAAPNIFSLDTNSEWKARRNAFRHAFTTTSLKHFEGAMRSLLAELAAELAAVAASASKTVAIDNLFARFTLDIIYNVGFELNKGFLRDVTGYEKLNSAVQDFLQLSSIVYFPGGKFCVQHQLKLFPALSRYIEALQVIRGFQLEVFKHLRTKFRALELSNASFGYMLMQFAEENCLAEEEVLSELLLFIIAGHETTAHTLSWLVYAAAAQPDMQEQCYQAVKDATTNTGGLLNPFVALPVYVEAFIKETMRKYPVANRGVLRQVTQEDGFSLPTGLLNTADDPHRYPDSVQLRHRQWVLVNFHSLHNATDNWGEDADQFRPERWLDSTKPHLQSPATFAGTGRDPDAIDFSPFAYGMRNCIGMNLAMFEIRAVFSSIVQEFQFKLADDRFFDDKVVIMTDITAKPLDALPVIVSKRNS